MEGTTTAQQRRNGESRDADTRVLSSAEEAAGLEHAPVIEVLGSVRVVGSDGAEVETGGRATRTVLAMLAVNHSVPTSTDALIDAVWGDEPPVNAAASLRNH